MNGVSIFVLKVLRKLHGKFARMSNLEKPECTTDPNLVSKIMREELCRNKPSMIARFGANELATVANYLSIKEGNPNYFKFITGQREEWWWNKGIKYHMGNIAGFFPVTNNNLERFSELMINDIKELDILGSWLPQERLFESEMKAVIKLQREVQNPFFVENPWTMALKNKKILVIHPFVKLIAQQYTMHRLNLFENKAVLPEFELITYEAVQSIGGKHKTFKNWFEALDYMKDGIDKLNFDIALIGCGAYGFPLAAHIKRQGKKAVHLGGSLQLLFGIRGRRWEDPNYNKDYNYSALMNEYWVRPDAKLRPKYASKYEDACYW